MGNITKTTFTRFINLLQDQLDRPLPGKYAQNIMIPKTHDSQMRFNFDEVSARNAAILIMLYLKNKSIYTVLIKRNSYPGVHSNQISFPGGKTEDEDKSLAHTACREAHEEIGIKIKSIGIIGNLSNLYIPPSNYLVSPFVAYYENIPVFHADHSEVERILEIKLSGILDERSLTEEIVYSSGKEKIKAPCFQINDNVIWGATAMIISELKVIINKNKELSSILQS